MPTDGNAAWLSIPARQQATVAFLACGQELQFLSGVRAGDSGSDALALSLAKMYWFAGMPKSDGVPRLSSPIARVTVPPDCHQQVQVWRDQVPADDKAPPSHDPAAIVQYGQELDQMVNQPQGNLVGTHLNSVFVRLFGNACDSIIQAVALSAAGRYNPDTKKVEPSNVLTITFDVSPRCLQAQFNYALNQAHVTGQMGTGNGTVCHVVTTLSDSDGNWDMSSRVLIRALYLDRLYGRNRRLGMLGPQVRDYIRQKLIITDIRLGEPDYPMTGCGDSEHAEGDAANRVDDPNFFQQLGDDFGSFFDWLLKHWYVAIPALPELGADPFLQALAVGATYTDAVVQALRVPETENHRLMIESTRYLNNQLLSEDLQNDSGRLDTLNDAQKDVRKWLLERMQDILHNDFIEYNARPYQRESIAALLNLYDFAWDPEVSDAAHIVLEYAFAKFAVGSNQGRRLVPFRRHMEDVHDHIEDGENVMFTGAEADHQEALSLLYTGQTKQLDKGYAPTVFPGEAAFGAFSWYLPHKLTLDLAIVKSVPYFQRFRHAGLEVYSSGKGYLITAGGIVTDPAYTVAGVGKASDKGAAVPTTIMFPSGIGKATMQSFLQFQGMREQVKGNAFESAVISYDHNTCVTQGFACGLNLYVPDDMKACFTPGPAAREPNWFFFNSATCPGYGDGPPVFLVLYQNSCLSEDPNCQTIGFVEAVDQTAPTQANFGAFIAGVMNRNPPGLIKNVTKTSTYNTSDGRRIDFDPIEHLVDSGKTGIKSINGTAQPVWTAWAGAEGNFIDQFATALISKTDAPVVTIKNSRFPGQSITLDFGNAQGPRYVAP
jgi:hypothetical protein